MKKNLRHAQGKVAVAMSGPVKSLRSHGANQKVAVALSGGVDSGVAAALLVKQGYQCAGFHMHLWKEPGSDVENKCCSTESLEAARKTAHQLGMQFHTIDFSKIFKKRVVDYFLESYAAGLTPNPCVVCNQFIKFGELFNYIKKLGFDYLATGHYSRLMAEIPNSKFQIYHLLQAKDKSKDQSYFLYNLTQTQLAQVLFPVGDYAKKQVREMAKKWQLPVAERPESQEICFFPETDYRPFLKRRLGKKIMPGKVVNTQGRMIGRHQGLPLYTIGQRHGFEITDKKTIGPLYVITKKPKENQLVVGFGKETERREFEVEQVNWIDQNSKFKIQNSKFYVRICHQGKLMPCQLTRVSNIKYRVSLIDPSRGIAPGQAAVFYGSASPLATSSGPSGSPQAKEVLGGGIICY